MKIAMTTCLLMTLATWGCDSQPATTPVTPPTMDKLAEKPAEKPGTETKSEPTAPIPKAKPLAVLDYDGIQKLIASHRGKIVVLDAWATYCPPCMKEFHHLVELHKEYGADKVACVSLSFDFGDDDVEMKDLKPRIQAFLDRQGATFDNIVSSDDYETLYKKFDFSAIPAVFVYGADGKLIERVDHSGDDESPIYERVKALLEKHVAAGKS